MLQHQINIVRAAVSDMRQTMARISASSRMRKTLGINAYHATATLHRIAQCSSSKMRNSASAGICDSTQACDWRNKSPAVGCCYRRIGACCRRHADITAPRAACASALCAMSSRAAQRRLCASAIFARIK